MAFWGVLLKPNEPYNLQRDDDGAPKRLRVSQATLADRSGLWTSRSVVRCSVGSKPPVFLCSLSIKEVASCQLDLEFEEKDDVVFSVKGPRGVHLAGYFLNSSGTNSTTTTLTTDAPTIPLEGKKDVVKMGRDGPSKYNSPDVNITHIDDNIHIPPSNREIEDGALQQEYNANEMNGGSLLETVVSDDANEEQIIEKTNESSEDLDKIHAVECIAGVGEENRSVVHKCDSEVVKADVVLGDTGKLNNSNSLEKLLVEPTNVFKENQHQAMVANAIELLQENEYVSPSWKSSECNDGLRHCGKVKKKKRKETVTECKFVEDDARNAAHQVIRDKNFEIVVTDLCPSQDKILSISPRKKLKKVEVGDGSFQKMCFDLPDDALESHTKLQKRNVHNSAGDGYTRSHSQSKKVRKKNIKKLGPFWSTPKDTNHKNTFGEGFDEKKELLANDGNQRQNKILDDKIEQASGLSISHKKKKKKKKVRMGEVTVGEKDLNPQDHALVSQSKLPIERLHDDNGYALERSHSNAMKEKRKKKKKKQDLDDGKHCGKRRKTERIEVGREEATDGSVSEKGKSSKKSDVKNIKGDVQDRKQKGELLIKRQH